ncbi:MAG: lysine--tRNA ligase [Gemmatimonadetes bacterium]|jgi:lysyl-tRNA synthetase, class I|nr:lysine--tRNA ligase [Gemmatimonadota bacterium]MBT6145892.1 lysine--tRNA ligase [Gemmatimonadota bacterium]MBT7863902.1 lysine--tRNA ligase [Gemmatimonadota bacterium]
MAKRSWPFAEATQIQQRRTRQDGNDRPVLFQTGYGPSGLPHIGTFAEVARSSFVRTAYEQLTGEKTRLQAFSDDMDGLVKVPGNIPNGEQLLGPHLGKPLSVVPDPFGCCESFSDHNNKKLQQFLDAYGFDYEFKSSRQAYADGEFDEGLVVLLEKVDEILEVILPTMREENRAGWSPFFPICPACGSVYATRVTAYHPEQKSLSYSCDRASEGYKGCGSEGELSVLGGHVKVGWKIDWALRWFTYDVDYEMSGKDLIDSVRLSSRIIKVMGKQPPTTMIYELFLDEEGKKISKSVGKGLSVDHWVDFAPIESLLYYILQNPQRAKRLYWDVVPKCVDDYLEALRRWPEVADEKREDTDVWHVFAGGKDVPAYDASVNFTVVGNLISALGTDDETVLRDFLLRYDPAIGDYPDVLAALVHKGLNYYREQVVPHKVYREPTEMERALFGQLCEQLEASDAVDEKELQSIPFDVARAADQEPRELFTSFYEVILGQERGPRFGTFVRLIGKDRVLNMLREKIG